MSDDGEGKIVQTAQAIAAIAEVVPVYQDAIQPAAKEVGKSLQVIGRAVNVALSPIVGLVWGAEQIQQFIYQRVGAKLENVPPEDIIRPKSHIAVPVVDALRYIGEDIDLSDMYANLLATSMDKKTAYRAHPGFVDIIRNMSPDEAKIIKLLSKDPNHAFINIYSKSISGPGQFLVSSYDTILSVSAGCEHHSLVGIYINNLERLGLVDVPEFGSLLNEALYEEIKNLPEVVDIISEINNSDGREAHIEKRRLQLSTLGHHFVVSCVIEKELQPRN